MIPLKDDNPARTVPFVTFLLVAANVAAFLFEMILPPRERAALVLRMGLVPLELTTGESLGADFPVPLTLLTSMFLHGSIMHLLGNMLYLWIFGNNVEDATGHGRFLIFYLLCGLVAAAAQVLSSPYSQVPMIGASGAIAGVLGAYMLLFPHARVLTLLPLFIFIQFVYLPAGLVLALWFLYQIVLSTAAGPSSAGGVAFFAHIGGFVGGMLLVWLFVKRRPRRRRYELVD